MRIIALPADAGARAQDGNGARDDDCPQDDKGARNDNVPNSSNPGPDPSNTNGASPVSRAYRCAM
jgi:hypothetical protein